MKIPKELDELIDIGVIEQILRPLQSGKEAQVFLVRHKGEERIAKVYKDAQNRSFKHRSQYTEGRKVRNSRQSRAMQNKSKYGKAEMEAAWKIAEVQVLRKLQAAGVRVPEAYDFIDGVLIMEFICTPEGEPAPRLADVEYSRKDAKNVLQILIRDVVKMLCAGIIHGDLSDFNILIDEQGPVIIDFPQAVEPLSNNNAKRLLIRDVKNITKFLSRFDRNLRKLRYGPEMWSMFEKGELQPDSVLTGHFVDPTREVDTEAVLREIQIAAREEAQKRGLSKYAKKQQTTKKSSTLRSNDPKPLSEDEVKKMDALDARKSDQRRSKKFKKRNNHDKNKPNFNSKNNKNSGNNKRFQHKRKFRR
jgi:RIO kinase 1